MPPSAQQITMPRCPQPAARSTFPYLASIAPVLVSVAIWLVTQSPFALLFAALGPVVAVGSLLDSRLQARRTAKSESARFEAEIAEATAAVAAAQDAERAVLLRKHPSLSAFLGGGSLAGATDCLTGEAWHADAGEGAPLRLGLGRVPCALELRGDPDQGNGAADPRLVTLRERAGTLSDAPVLVDGALGLGLCGTRAQTQAALRGLVLQLAAQLRPDRFAIRLTGDWAQRDAPDAEWLEHLPHPVETSPDALAGEGAAVMFHPLASAAGDPSRGIVLLRSAPQPGLLGGCRVVVAVGAEAEVLRHPESDGQRRLSLDYLTAEQAVGVAQLLRAEADRRGYRVAASALPERLELAAIFPTGDEFHAAVGLPATVLAGADGVFGLDIVRDGPHAIVGGTTGSGKSEFLISWVLGMAAVASPERLAVLLVDFKGGSTFGGLSDLPHCVGVITDLDNHTALRALESLRAEISYRERLLATHGARAIEELGEGLLPRLVLVVDEFAAMVAEFPELHGLFADIASRGRSLGVHLILCTQRPAGVVRDAVLANSGLRLSLRVNNAADSTAVIGTDLASRLPSRPAGRAALSIAGEAPRLVQAAIATEADVDRVRSVWGAQRVPSRRPWCEPLPAMLVLADLLAREGGDASNAAAGIPLGLSDLPREQRQAIACFDPASQGHLLVLGGQRSGKSTVLDTIAAGAVSSTRIGADPELLWDVVHEWASALDELSSADPIEAGTEAIREAHLLLIDDVDATLAHLGEDHRAALLDMLGRIAREGAARGIHLVLSAQRLGGALQSLAQLLEAHLLLRLPTKQDHLLAGGAGEDFDAAAPAGRGTWRGNAVQIAVAGSAAAGGPLAGVADPAVTTQLGTTQPGTTQFVTTQPVTASPAPTPPVIAVPRLREIALTPGQTLAVVAAHPTSWRRRGDGGSEPPVMLELSDNPILDAEALTVHSGGRGTVVLGDIEAWQSNWAALAAVRGRVPMLFDGCSVADFRSITRRRELPPPLRRPGGAWLLSPDGTVERVRMTRGDTASKPMIPHKKEV